MRARRASAKGSTVWRSSIANVQSNDINSVEHKYAACAITHLQLEMCNRTCAIEIVQSNMCNQKYNMCNRKRALVYVQRGNAIE